MAYTLAQLAELFDAKIIGDANCLIDSVAPVQDAHDSAISFVSSPRFAKYLADTKAAAVIVSEDLIEHLSGPALLVKNPRASYARIATLLYPQLKPAAGIHASAVIEPSAQIDESAYIGANCVIEAGVYISAEAYIGPSCVIGRDSVIGAGSYLHANVTIYSDCKLGKHCIIHSSTVIGADGFGFEHDAGEWVKIPQVGGVQIGDHVEIGACSTVDRGALQDTVIADGVKLDNHIQIAHNVKVGAHTVMSNGVGVAGSTVIGENCLIGGMTGIKDNIEITDNVIITAMSLVSKSLTKAGSYSSNTPIDDTRTWRKNSARFRQLDVLARRIQDLEKQIKELSIKIC